MLERGDHGRSAKPKGAGDHERGSRPIRFHCQKSEKHYAKKTRRAKQSPTTGRKGTGRGSSHEGTGTERIAKKKAAMRKVVRGKHRNQTNIHHGVQQEKGKKPSNQPRLKANSRGAEITPSEKACAVLKGKMSRVRKSRWKNRR